MLGDGKLYCDDCNCRHDLDGCGKLDCVHCYDQKVVSFNSSSRDEEPVPEEYGDSSVSMEELLNKESD